MYNAKRVAASVSVPSYFGCVVFGAFVAVFTGLLNVMLRASMGLFAFSIYLIPFALLALTYRVLFWRSAYALSILLLAPLGLVSSLRGVDWNFTLDHFCLAWAHFDVALVAFGVGGAAGFFAGLASALLMREARWAGAAGWIRWAGMALLALVVLATIPASWRRASVDDYPASLPIVAQLPALEEGSGANRSPLVAGDGPVRLERRCEDPYNRACRVAVFEQGKERTNEERVCVEEQARSALRRDDARGLWLVVSAGPKSKAESYAAFRLDPTTKSGLRWVELTTSEILSSTRLSFAWVLVLVMGAGAAIHATRRRARNAAESEAARHGAELIADRGWVTLPGVEQPVRVANVDAAFSGPVILASPGALPGTYRDNAAPESATALARGCARPELIEAIRRRILAWDLFGIAAVAAALVAVGPWLVALVRWVGR